MFTMQFSYVAWAFCGSYVLGCVAPYVAVCVCRCLSHGRQATTNRFQVKQYTKTTGVVVVVVVVVIVSIIIVVATIVGASVHLLANTACEQCVVFVLA